MISDNSIFRLDKKCKQESIKNASETLDSAFKDYNLFKFFFPNTIERYKKIGFMHTWYIQAAISYGEVYVTSQNFEGVALWYFFWENDITLERFDETGGKEYLKNLNPDRILYRKFRLAENLGEKLHRKHANFPHWYFNMVGVDPNYQGKGYTSLLIRKKLCEIDEQNMLCYGETHEKENIPIFEHFGFRVVDKARIPKSDVFIWALLRK